MSTSNTQTTTTSTDLPVAAIVCLAVGGYTALILIIVCVRQILLSRGVCSAGSDCAPCGKEGNQQCSDCCISMSEGCNCCNPSVDGCLNTICPNRKNLSCVDILLCQCFGNNCFTNGDASGSCGYCACNCSECGMDSCPECSTLNCCCFEIRFRQNRTQSPVEPFTLSQSQSLPLPSTSHAPITSQYLQPQHQETQFQSQQKKHVSWKNNEQKCQIQQLPASDHQSHHLDSQAKGQTRRPLPPPPIAS